MMYISNRIPYVFAHLMEKSVLEMACHLVVCYPSRALELNPALLQRRHFLLVTLGNLVQILHKDIERCHCAKNYSEFL